MLSVLGVNEIVNAILTEDVKTISKTPGLGAKTAGRLINDLKDKVGAYSLPGTLVKANKAVAASESLTETEEECIIALVNLGYPRSNAVKAVQMVEDREGMSAEELIRPALKNVITL
jgi:Holliday junction DNA helicase RuvA